MADLDKPVKLIERTVIGKGLSGIRAEGMVPAVIHNHGSESIHVMANEPDLTGIYRAAGKHHPLNLEVGSNKYLVLIKDAHFNPVKRRLQHMVFQAIRQDEAVEAEIPVHVEGEIPAEKVGLMVLRQLDHVEVEALPKDLPDELTVDGTVLAEIGDKIMVADIVAPEGVTITTDAEHPVASVVETKAQISEEETAEEAKGEEGEAPEGDEGEQAKDDSTQESAEPKQN